MYFYEKLGTYRKHFEDLQPIGSPAFLGFVDWQREVNVSGILREEQHQEDGPVERNNLVVFIIFYTVYSPVRKLVLFSCSISSHLRLTRAPEASEPINYLNCL